MVKLCKFILPLVFLICISAHTPVEIWKQFLPDISARFISFDWQGNRYAINANGEAYVLSGGRNKQWEPLFPGKKLKCLDVFPDGTILALSKPTALFTSALMVNGRLKMV